MPACGSCGKRWPDDVRVCPDDGTPLATLPADGALALDAHGGDDDLEPGSMAGDYRIEHKLGEGGMGTVYGARHPVIGKRAAIKVLRSDLSASRVAVDRFVLEAQAVNRIGHSNIVDVFGFGQLDDGRAFIAMEWLQGESLGSRLARPIGFAEAIDIIDEIVKALEAAHDAGVVHRDLKPDNVFLVARRGECPTVKLLDFGLAKLVGRGENRTPDRTRTGVVIGTPLYISPEQAKGVKVDMATDIYSLGAIAFEMFTGRVPFTADSSIEIMSKHITDEPPRPSSIKPDLPAEVDDLLLAMLRKDPATRPWPAVVREQLAALRELVPVDTPRARRVSTPVVAAATAPSARPRERFAVIVLATVLAGFALAAAAYVVFTGSKDEQPRADVTSPAVTPGDAKLVEPVQVAPVGPPPTKPAEPKPAEPKPAEPKPAEPKPIVKLQKGTLIVRIAGAPNGRVTVDGRPTADDVSETRLELAPGSHHVTAEYRHRQAAANVRLEAGKRAVVTLTIPPVDPNSVRDPFPADKQ